MHCHYPEKQHNVRIRRYNQRTEDVLVILTYNMLFIVDSSQSGREAIGKKRNQVCANCGSEFRRRRCLRFPRSLLYSGTRHTSHFCETESMISAQTKQNTGERTRKHHLSRECTTCFKFIQTESKRERLKEKDRSRQRDIERDTDRQTDRPKQ